MKRTKCYECYCELFEYNEFECQDEEGSDAVWEDSRKEWICNSCKYCD